MKADEGELIIPLPPSWIEGESGDHYLKRRHPIIAALALIFISCSAGAIGNSLWAGRGSSAGLSFTDAIGILRDAENRDPLDVQSAAVRAKVFARQSITELQSLSRLKGASHEKTRRDAGFHLSWLKSRLEGR